MMSPQRAVRLAKPLVVGRRTVDGGDRHVVHAQVHRQLAAMVGEVVDGIAQHDVPRLFRDGLTGDEQTPRFHQVLVVAAL